MSEALGDLALVGAQRELRDGVVGRGEHKAPGNLPAPEGESPGLGRDSHARHAEVEAAAGPSDVYLAGHRVHQQAEVDDELDRLARCVDAPNRRIGAVAPARAGDHTARLARAEAEELGE